MAERERNLGLESLEEEVKMEEGLGERCKQWLLIFLSYLLLLLLLSLSAFWLCCVGFCSESVKTCKGF